MEKKTFICLSKSKKNNDFCVAGKIWYGDGNIGDWIRPINNHGAIDNSDCLYENKSHAQILDIINAEFIKPNPQKFQTENYLINSECYWVKEGVYSSDYDSLMKLCDAPKTLWSNNYQTNSGKYDQVLPEEANSFNESLYFIYVDNLTFITSRWEDENVKVRAEFTYNRVAYNLKVTDIKWLEHFEGKSIGEHHKGCAFMTISLALDTYTNNSGTYHYKLIAEII